MTVVGETKIIKVKGGLGNQMFQYAFARLLSEKYGCQDVKLDFSYFGTGKVDDIRVSRLSRMNTKIEVASEADIDKCLFFKHTGNPLSSKYRLKVGAEAVLNRKYYFEPDRAYRDPKTLMKYNYLDGYWQSWQYLDPIRDTLKQEFSCDNISEKTADFIKQYQSCNSVFVGVRRGDYIADKKNLKRFGKTDLEYYHNAVKIIKDKIPSAVFVFFSNDIEWVKQNLNYETLQLEKNAVLYRNNQDIVDDFEELYVMSACRNAIISNSTFNFWGAWMIENEQKVVIAPKNWFKDGGTTDIVPKDWIRME